MFKYLFFIAIIVIDFLAFSSSGVEDHISTGWDKLNHLLAFGVLYVLVSLGFRKWSMKFKVVLLLIYAIHIEMIQYFIPGREFSFLDIFADGVGIAIGIVVFAYTPKSYT